MRSGLPEVTVIVRTRGDASRHTSLQRAVRSVISQDGVRAQCLVVLNGPDARPVPLPDMGVTWLCAPHADKAMATAIGRAAVRTEYFSYLDDDDELLPGALAYRTGILERTDADCAATNGEYAVNGAVKRALYVKPEPGIDYADEMLKARNWLASCGATFRTATVTQMYFENLPPHCEWTVIGFRIAARLRIDFSETPTYRIHSSPHSQSKLPAYVETLPGIVEDMLRWNDKARRLPGLLRRRAIANHIACSYHRIHGNFARAWHFYWRSVLTKFGLRYVPYAALLLVRSRAPVTRLKAAPMLWIGALLHKRGALPAIEDAR